MRFDLPEPSGDGHHRSMESSGSRPAPQHSMSRSPSSGRPARQTESSVAQWFRHYGLACLIALAALGLIIVGLKPASGWLGLFGGGGQAAVAFEIPEASLLEVWLTLRPDTEDSANASAAPLLDEHQLMPGGTVSVTLPAGQRFDVLVSGPAVAAGRLEDLQAGARNSTRRWRLSARPHPDGFQVVRARRVDLPPLPAAAMAEAQDDLNADIPPEYRLIEPETLDAARFVPIAPAAQPAEGLDEEATIRAAIDRLLPTVSAITGALETGSIDCTHHARIYAQLGNISIGCLNMALNRSLPRLLKELEGRSPGVLAEVFGEDYPALESLLAMDLMGQRLELRSQDEADRQRWETHLRALVRREPMRALLQEQRERHLMRTLKIAKAAGIRSDRGVAMLFDAQVMMGQQTGLFPRWLQREAGDPARLSEKQKLSLLRQFVTAKARGTPLHGYLLARTVTFADGRAKVRGILFNLNALGLKLTDTYTGKPVQ